jgi:hypothetical protein
MTPIALDATPSPGAAGRPLCPRAGTAVVTAQHDGGGIPAGGGPPAGPGWPGFQSAEARLPGWPCAMGWGRGARSPQASISPRRKNEGPRRATEEASMALRAMRFSALAAGTIRRRGRRAVCAVIVLLLWRTGQTARCYGLLREGARPSPRDADRARARSGRGERRCPSGQSGQYDRGIPSTCWPT